MRFIEKKLNLIGQENGQSKLKLPDEHSIIGNSQVLYHQPTIDHSIRHFGIIFSSLLNCLKLSDLWCFVCMIHSLNRN